MAVIKKATIEDVAAITAIYNDAILKLSATFDTEPKSLEEENRWFAAHSGKFPVLVAESDGKVTGWASLSKWSDRCAYSETAEASMYISEESRGQGTGRKLLSAILEEGQKAGLHTVIARIVEGNAASIHLCESMGFEHIGTMKEVGRKFGKLLDVHLMQIIFPKPVYY
ncbi:MAG: N-acetyltransferase family protein [Dehalococcoidia bacterium]|nr:MAG: N-acetyltransferase family protein [Dehalococcoidia bacterium]